jgi:hypothetical protein
MLLLKSQVFTLVMYIACRARSLKKFDMDTADSIVFKRPNLVLSFFSLLLFPYFSRLEFDFCLASVNIHSQVNQSCQVLCLACPTPIRGIAALRPIEN